MISTKPAKAKVCQVCRTEFRPMMPLARVCSPFCALSHAKSVNGKAAKVAAVKDRRETKAKIEEMLPHKVWLTKAKTAMQKRRRLEELALGSPCMSCQRSQQEVEGTDAWKPGGAWDGGHFMSKGARPELALEPLNIWLQCKSCNGGSGKYARKGYTVNANFETNLIARIGQEAVDALRADHRQRHYSIDELKAITLDCNARVLVIQKQERALQEISDIGQQVQGWDA